MPTLLTRSHLRKLRVCSHYRRLFSDAFNHHAVPITAANVEKAFNWGLPVYRLAQRIGFFNAAHDLNVTFAQIAKRLRERVRYL